MASIITADNGGVSGTAGLKQSADSSGILALATGTGTTAVTIDASQAVLVGLTTNGTDTNKLRVAGANANTTAAAQFRVENLNGQTRLSLSSYQTSNTVNFIAGGSLVNPAFVWANNDGSQEHMRLDNTGNLMVGATSAQTNVNGITTVGSNGNSYQCVADNTSGTIGTAVYRARLSNASATTSSYFFLYATNGAGSTYSLRADGSSSFSSDQTLKKNIVDSRGYLEDLMKLRPVSYHWKTQDDTDPVKWLGLIAQEVEEVFPGLVCEDKAEEGETPTKAVKYSVLPMMMLKAIQEQQAIITTLTERIAALEAK